MKFFIKLLSLMLLQLSLNSAAGEITFEFGQVKVDENSEPVGFEKTLSIPISNDGKNVMYGLIVTSSSDRSFSLDSVHTLPTLTKETTKLIGKTINVKTQAAIFLRTQSGDIPGDYMMEVFIDGTLKKTFKYQLTAKADITVSGE